MVENQQKDLLDALKLELKFLERGGYEPSVREPRKELSTFLDSPSCLNYGCQRKRIHVRSAGSLISFRSRSVAKRSPAITFRSTTGETRSRLLEGPATTQRSTQPCAIGFAGRFSSSKRPPNHGSQRDTHGGAEAPSVQLGPKCYEVNDCSC